MIDEYHKEIQKYIDSESNHACPKCGEEVEIIGMHERDSSNDIHKCPKCGWECGEMYIWNIENGVHEKLRHLYGNKKSA